MLSRSLCVFITAFLCLPLFGADTLKGAWTRTNCPISRNKELSIHQLVFGETLTQRSSYYNDKACKNPSMVVTSEYAYETDQGGALTATLKSLSWTLHTLATVELYNEWKTCGFSDWKVGQAKEITGARDCRGLDAKKDGAVSHNIVKFENGELRLWREPSDWGGLGADLARERPSDFNPSSKHRYYVKDTK